MFENAEMTDVVKQFLPVLFSTFLLRMGSTNGIDAKSAFGRNPIESEPFFSPNTFSFLFTNNTFFCFVT